MELPVAAREIVAAARFPGPAEAVVPLRGPQVPAKPETSSALPPVAAESGHRLLSLGV